MIALFGGVRNKMGRRFMFQRRPPTSTTNVRSGVAAAVTLISLGTALSFARAPLQKIYLPAAVPTSPQAQEPRPLTEPEPSIPLTPKQKQDLLRSSFDKMKRDSEDLVSLAKSLQQDIEKSNENVLSLKVVERAEKIEKLARKIKATAKGV